MSESWADYMRQHGADEYSAWDEDDFGFPAGADGTREVIQ
jgi:hypothetical protein